MRLLPFLVAFAVTACTTAEAQDPAATPTGVEWELLAIDGQVVDIPATLRLGETGGVGGKAPCNSYGGQNRAELPDFRLSPLRVTRMACDRLADEKLYLSTLSAMTRVDRLDDRTLVLTGPDGRSMEFARDLMSTLTRCTTCAPKG
ncbi:MAG TPA: META domain-containing protein [Tabrizicola sp.]|nr:META domain-containing protein [Tabrizicola sp.]